MAETDMNLIQMSKQDQRSFGHIMTINRHVATLGDFCGEVNIPTPNINHNNTNTT